jgi:hypothetical protein
LNVRVIVIGVPLRAAYGECSLGFS